MRRGYVYILTNPCIIYHYTEGKKKFVVCPVKIGISYNRETRVGNLNTALPEDFVHHMSVETNDPQALENMVHTDLKQYRIKTKLGAPTEFFTCSVSIACKALKAVAKKMHIVDFKIIRDKFIGRSATKIRSNALKSTKAKNNAVRKTWDSKSQFALWIAKKGGSEGSLGHILSVLRGTRPCADNSKWRKLLEREGIKFNATNFIKNWSSFEKSFIKQK